MAGPILRVPLAEFAMGSFIEVALTYLVLATGGVFDVVPKDENDRHEAYCGDEIPLNTRVVFERVNVHTEKADEECQGKEDESYPR